MGRLTRRQREVLEAIREFTERWGFPPSVRDLCRALGARSSSTIHIHLTTLEKKGYISRVPRSPRTITIKAHPDGGTP